MFKNLLLSYNIRTVLFFVVFFLNVRNHLCEDIPISLLQPSQIELLNQENLALIIEPENISTVTLNSRNSSSTYQFKSELDPDVSVANTTDDYSNNSEGDDSSGEYRVEAVGKIEPSVIFPIETIGRHNLTISQHKIGQHPHLVTSDKIGKVPHKIVRYNARRVAIQPFKIMPVNLSSIVTVPHVNHIISDKSAALGLQNGYLQNTNESIGTPFYVIVLPPNETLASSNFSLETYPRIPLGTAPSEYSEVKKLAKTLVTMQNILNDKIASHEQQLQDQLRQLKPWSTKNNQPSMIAETNMSKHSNHTFPIEKIGQLQYSSKYVPNEQIGKPLHTFQNSVAENTAKFHQTSVNFPVEALGKFWPLLQNLSIEKIGKSHHIAPNVSTAKIEISHQISQNLSMKGNGLSQVRRKVFVDEIGKLYQRLPNFTIKKVGRSNETSQNRNLTIGEIGTLHNLQSNLPNDANGMSHDVHQKPILQNETGLLSLGPSIRVQETRNVTQNLHNEKLHQFKHISPTMFEKVINPSHGIIKKLSSVKIGLLQSVPQVLNKDQIGLTNNRSAVSLKDKIGVLHQNHSDFSNIGIGSMNKVSQSLPHDFSLPHHVDVTQNIPGGELGLVNELFQIFHTLPRDKNALPNFLMQNVSKEKLATQDYINKTVSKDNTAAQSHVITTVVNGKLAVESHENLKHRTKEEVGQLNHILPNSTVESFSQVHHVFPHFSTEGIGELNNVSLNISKESNGQIGPIMLNVSSESVGQTGHLMLNVSSESIGQVGHVLSNFYNESMGQLREIVHNTSNTEIGLLRQMLLNLEDKSGSLPNIPPNVIQEEIVGLSRLLPSLSKQNVGILFQLLSSIPKDKIEPLAHLLNAIPEANEKIGSLIQTELGLSSKQLFPNLLTSTLIRNKFPDLSQVLQTLPKEKIGMLAQILVASPTEKIGEAVHVLIVQEKETSENRNESTTKATTKRTTDQDLPTPLVVERFQINDMHANSTDLNTRQELRKNILHRSSSPSPSANHSISKSIFVGKTHNISVLSAFKLQSKRKTPDVLRTKIPHTTIASSMKITPKPTVRPSNTSTKIGLSVKKKKKKQILNKTTTKPPLPQSKKQQRPPKKVGPPSSKDMLKFLAEGLKAVLDHTWTSLTRK